MNTQMVIINDGYAGANRLYGENIRHIFCNGLVEVAISIDNIRYKLMFWHDTVNEVWPTTDAVVKFLHQYRMIAGQIWYLVKAFYNEEILDFPLIVNDDWPPYFSNR